MDSALPRVKVMNHAVFLPFRRRADEIWYRKREGKGSLIVVEIQPMKGFCQ